jgi:hypothetical protein
MNDVRKQAKSPPVKSPSLPGFSIDANVCRNPACENFGVSEEDIQPAEYGYEYKITNGVFKHACKRCNQTHLAYSNASVFEAFHRCLQDSIPYASCPNPKCKNHFVNLFEHYHDDPRDKREKLYRINVSDDAKQYYQARCRSCKKSTFPLSKPLRLHISERRTWQKDMGSFIKEIVNGSGPSRVMNKMEFHGDRYYSQLKAASNALLNYNNFHLINLLKPSGNREPMRIYTDCIVCSIKMNRGDQRVQLMKIVVSIAVLNGRLLILAFHPLFDQRTVDDNTLINDHKQPFGLRRYEYLKHLFNMEKKGPLPPIGIGGYFMEDFYAYMGHFLVLRKLLAQVPSLTFYLDGEASQYNAALTAFSDRIKTRSCDIVVRKLEDAPKGSNARTSGDLLTRYRQVRSQAKKAYRKVHPDSGALKDPELRRFLLNEEMQRVNEAIKNSSTEKNGELFPLSRIYKTATTRAKKDGNEFWVINQLNGKYNQAARMLWLTRTAKLSNTDYELDLYLNGSIFYIDNIFSYFRHRSSFAARPLATATGHKSYNKNPELPINLIHDFTINVAFWNFFLKYRSVPKETIAYVHGLVNKPGSPETKVAFQPRYTFDNAKRITKWLGI